MPNLKIQPCGECLEKALFYIYNKAWSPRKNNGEWTLIFNPEFYSNSLFLLGIC